MKYIVTSDTPLWIKETASITGKNVGLVHSGDTFEVINEYNGYVQTERGYILKDLNSIALVQPVLTMTAVSTTAASPLTTAVDASINNTESSYFEDDDEYTAAKLKMTQDEVKKIMTQPENTNSKTGEVKQSSNTDKAGNPQSSTSNITVVHLDQFIQNALNRNLMFSNTNGIYGLPYQWLPIADPRITADKYTTGLSSPGRIYAEKIISRIPLLLISPGGPHYNATGNLSIQQILEKEVTVGEELAKAELDKNDGIFYSFEYDLVQYFNYVNPILRLASRCLNIEDRTYIPASGGKAVRLDEFNWEENYNKAIHGTDVSTDSTTTHGVSGMTNGVKKSSSSTPFVGARSIAFYLDSDFSESDSISNSTQESTLKSVNSMTSRAAEIQMLAGMGESALLGTNKILETSNDIKTKLAALAGTKKDSRFFNTLMGTASTLMEGGKLMFPSIWGDSSFGRSYEAKFKFVSPDYDTYSWFINIMVPLVHLICLTFPRKASNSFAYTCPFLVRAFYKGMFNCDLGIISSLTINRGQECGWTQSGLPTIVEVSMTIQDLYDGIAMSRSDVGGTSGMFAILKNPIYLDYIANMCGLNLNEPDVRRLISFYKILAGGAVSDVGKTIMGNAEQYVNNLLINIFGKMQRAGL